MYPKKHGGGGLPELYDPENGQYVSEEDKAKYLDNEIGNIVMRYIFGINGTYDPRFPIFGFHSDDYCELYVKYRICKIYQDIDYNKIDNYFLKPLTKNDKSNFFFEHGYDIDKRDNLYDQLYYGTDFAKMKFDHLNPYGIIVKIPTKIYSYKEKKDILIYTVWIYRKDEKFHLVTVDLEKR